MRDLKFITTCPTDTYFSWQVHLWLESLKQLGHSNKAIVLLFSPLGRPINPIWEKIHKLYPESEFHTYVDDGTINPFLGIYIPILRLYSMKKYCEEYPEIDKCAVFYCDSDIIFTEKFNIDHLLEDEIIYLSDTNSYINASYFDSKIKDVLPDRLEDYKKIDVLNEAAKIVGIDRQICEKNNLHSGGTQYLLKNTNADFWKTIFKKCIPLLSYLRDINKQYFANEDKGYQSWTCDMWLVLWELWKRGFETKIVDEMSFSWAPDPIEKLTTCPIYHNAGITGEFMDGIPYFYKGKYHTGTNPMIDTHLQTVINNEESKKHCTWFYANALNELNQKYHIDY
jgi:hypothetical protein